MDDNNSQNNVNQQYDEYGNPITVNPFGDPVRETNRQPEINPNIQYDEYGNPIYPDEYSSLNSAEANKGIALDQFGNPIQTFDRSETQYDQYGNQIQNAELSDNTFHDPLENASKIWMGKDLEKIQAKKFNVFALLFKGPYLLYKRVTGLGILFSFIEAFFITLTILSHSLVSIVALVAIELLFMLLCGFKYYSFYEKAVHNKLKKIIADLKDPVEYAQKNGGNAPLNLLVYVLVALIAAGIAFGFHSFIENVNSHAKPVENNTQNEVTNDVVIDPNSIDENALNELLENSVAGNIVVEPPVTTSDHFFLKTYKYTYDTEIWKIQDVNLGNTEKSVQLYNKNNEKLRYLGFTENIVQNARIDLNTGSGQTELYNIFLRIVPQFLSQEVQITPSENATFYTNEDKTIMYSYIDVLNNVDTSMSVQSNLTIDRYYLVYLKEQDVAFYFSLITGRTSVDSSTDIESVKVLKSITYVPEVEQVPVNTLNSNTTNTISNSLNEL